MPGTSQQFAVDTRCDHTLYHGTRGPGKTISQAMRYRRRVGIGYGSYWRGVIFDKEFKNLSDLVAQTKRFFYAFDDGAQFMESASDYKWKWPTGEELLLRHIKRPSDYDAFHGHEYPYIGWNELTKFANCDLYDKMMSTNRSSFLPSIHSSKSKNNATLPDIPLEVFSTTNPSGPGHNWVKRRFINVAPPGKVHRTKIKVFNPRTQKDVEIIKSQVAIFGSYRENKYLSPRYIAELDRLTASNLNLRKAWLEGSWDFASGNAIDDLWASDTHIIPNLIIPDSWHVDRSFDWGSSHPFAVNWWAEANGEEAKFENGGTFCPPAGSLINIAEWYGTTQVGTNVGLRYTASKIAEGILNREKIMKEIGICKTVAPGPADTQIWDSRESDVDTIANKMERSGVAWVRSDKTPGSRKNGLQLFRDRLYASVVKNGDPEIYFTRRCQFTIETLPNLPTSELDPDDIDSTSEDHLYDSVRYRILNFNKTAKTVNTLWPR